MVHNFFFREIHYEELGAWIAAAKGLACPDVCGFNRSCIPESGCGRYSVEIGPYV